MRQVKQTGEMNNRSIIIHSKEVYSSNAAKPVLMYNNCLNQAYQQV